MATMIRKIEPSDIDTVVEFSVRAWTPVFEAFERLLGGVIFGRLFPDWRSIQAHAVRLVCENEADSVWISERDGRPVGFAAVVCRGGDHPEPNSGEIEMIAVDPDYQRQGVAAALISVVLEEMRTAGCILAVVATGGDPGHGPARCAYEQAGFTALPQVRYYMAL